MLWYSSVSVSVPYPNYGSDTRDIHDVMFLTEEWNALPQVQCTHAASYCQYEEEVPGRD